ELRGAPAVAIRQQPTHSPAPGLLVPGGETREAGWIQRSAVAGHVVFEVIRQVGELGVGERIDVLVGAIARQRDAELVWPGLVRAETIVFDAGQRGRRLKVTDGRHPLGGLRVPAVRLSWGSI